MDDLAKRRAEKTQDSREWSALDALEDMVAQVKAGTIKPEQLSINWLESKPEGGYAHHYCVAGMTFQQHIALLHVSLARVLTQWLE